MITSGSVAYHPALQPLLEPIENVSPHPDNPSSGDDYAIATSIEISGMYRPVIAQRSTGHILAGNTTYAACLRLDADQIPVVWLDVDHETALRIMLGDNQLARLAVVDQGLLTPLLDALMATDLALLGTGYDTPPPIPEPTQIEPSYTMCVELTGDLLVDWFNLAGDTDRDRITALLQDRVVE
jgi:hypothetical protein